MEPSPFFFSLHQESVRNALGACSVRGRMRSKFELHLEDLLFEIIIIIMIVGAVVNNK